MNLLYPWYEAGFRGNAGSAAADAMMPARLAAPRTWD
jgi:hypothetical protein